MFNPNQTDFSCDYQREVWQFGIQIMPPEVSLAELTDPEIREGCMQLYTCTMEILKDMYNHWDEYISLEPRRVTNDYFGWLMHGGVQVKHRENFTRFLQLIPRHGFSYDENTKTLTNTLYPLFAEYWCRLAKLAKDKKQNLGGYLERRDFRLFAKRVLLTDDDLLRPLSEKYKEYFRELHGYALSKGAKIERKDACSFRYTHKKLYVLLLSNNPAHIEVPYRLNNAYYIPGQFERFLKVAEGQADNDALISYIQKNIGICDGCRYRAQGRKKCNERCGRWVMIRDARRFSAMCHASINKYHRGKRYCIYTDEDMQMLKRMIDIRIEQIDKS